jgi:hypothetical protein
LRQSLIDMDVMFSLQNVGTTIQVSYGYPSLVGPQR